MTPTSSALVQPATDAHLASDEGTLSDPGQCRLDPRTSSAEVGPSTPAHLVGVTQVTHGGDTSGGSHESADSQRPDAAANLASPTDPSAAPSPKGCPGPWEDALLLVYSDTLDDLERTRIATENRVRSIQQFRSVGAGTETEARLNDLCEAIRAMEHGITLELMRALRKHPLGGWVKRTVGVGEKQGARLIAAIGDPADRQYVSQLISYCGYGVRDGQAPTRKRGEYGGWNPTARMRTYLVAEAAVKAGVRKIGEPTDADGYDIDARKAITPLGQAYLDGRAKYADAIHAQPCKRCGPSGKPAPEGSPLSDGHKHARALRLVAKAVLKDLWREAHDLRSSMLPPTPKGSATSAPSDPGHMPRDTPVGSARVTSEDQP